LPDTPFEGDARFRATVISAREDLVQRLFSAFPNDWPGAGLLLLRVAVGVTTLVNSILPLLGDHSSSAAWMLALVGVGASLVLIGLWTPVGGALLVLAQLWITVGDTGINVSRVLATTIAVSLIMLGPGAWSVDARLYGRKRIAIPGR
jgi:putative oxidoreductase